jgi:hypothetical protein
LLLLQVPSKAQVSAVSEDLRRRSVVPRHIKALLEALPVDTHPMTQLVTLVSAMQVGGHRCCRAVAGVYSSCFALQQLVGVYKHVSQLTSRINKQLKWLICCTLCSILIAGSIATDLLYTSQRIAAQLHSLP